MNIRIYNEDPYGYNYISCFNNFKNDYVFVSKKVGFTSFSKIDDTKCKRVWEIINFNNSIMRAIVRNPYRRIESLYKDKCVMRVDENLIQNSQNEIINIFGKEKFFNKQICFEEFVNNLSKMIKNECHFFPQTEFIPNFVKYIHKIENIQEIENIFSIFDSDVKHDHITIDLELKWTSEMKNIINQLYTEDFKNFNYHYE